MKKLILGCGYVGLRVAQAWREDGHEVFALTRSSERASALRAGGIRPIVGDVTASLDLGSCDEIETVLFAIGFDRTVGNAIQDVYVDGLRRTLAQLSPLPRRFIYISSTGVYAQDDGGWVDEDSPCHPQRAGGRACLAAEDLLRQHSISDRTIILRLAGIYGPDRLPRLRDLVAGRSLSASPNGYLNLIHVDNAVRAILVAEQHATPPELFLVSDGQPVLRRDFYHRLSELTNSPEPTFEAPSLGSSSSERASSDKRIDSARLRDRLPFTFRYPSFVEGLESIVRGQVE